MVVGLVENFSVPKKLAMQLMVSLYFVFFLYWAAQLMSIQSHQSMAFPKDLDAIEKEFSTR